MKRKERKEQQNRKECEGEIENILVLEDEHTEEQREEVEDNVEKERPREEDEDRMEEEHRGQGEGPSNAKNTGTQQEEEGDKNKGQMDMFNIILREMKKNNEKMDDMRRENQTVNENINEKMDNMNENINEKMDDMRRENQTVNENINEKMDDMRRENQTVNENINGKIDNMKEELEKGIYDITVTISTELTMLKESVQENKNAINQVKEDLDTKIKQIEFRFNSNYQDTRVTHEKLINDVIERKTTKLSSTLHEQLQVTRTEVNEHLEQIGEEMVKQQTVIEKYIEINNVKITENEKTVKQCKENTNQWKTEMENFRKELGTNQLVTPQHISITCNGGSNNEIGMPKYGRRSNNPTEFITKLRNYYLKTQERGRNNNVMTLEEILEVALEDNVGKWWLSIRDNHNTFESFEEKFLSKYWSHDIQRGLKRRIELERFRPGGALSRSEYFIERVLLLGQMIPRLEESDIITILSERFNEQIQDARRVQNIQTVADFEKLLSRFDIEDDNRKLQNNNYEQRKNERNREQNRNYERNYQRTDENRYFSSYRYPQNNNPRGGEDRRNYPDRREDRRYQNPREERDYRNNREPLYQRQDTFRNQEKRYQPSYQYPDRRKYSSSDPPYQNRFNDEQKERNWKRRQEEYQNPRFQRYKTEEQEAICQNISVIRKEENDGNHHERQRGTDINSTSNNDPPKNKQTTEN